LRRSENKGDGFGGKEGLNIEVRTFSKKVVFLVLVFSFPFRSFEVKKFFFRARNIFSFWVRDPDRIWTPEWWWERGPKPDQAGPVRQSRPEWFRNSGPNIISPWRLEGQFNLFDQRRKL